jgi:apolipoprotein N-acyltransferase
LALLLALATAGLLYLCYFPVAFGWLAWVALVPLLVLVRRPGRPNTPYLCAWAGPFRRFACCALRWRPRTLYLCAWLGGMAFFFPLLQWMRVADPMMYFTWVALAIYSALYFPLALGLLRLLDRRTALPLTLTLPVVWCAAELFRSSFIGLFASLLLGSHQHDFPGGFSWYLLGHTQHDVLQLIQIADLGGVYAVTFLLAAANALLFEVLFARAWFRARFVGPGVSARSGWWAGQLGLLGQGLAVLALLVGTVAYGAWRLGQDTQEPGPKVALIQGDLPQSVRNDNSKKARQQIGDHYIRLCDLGAFYRPDLLVWPETSYPDTWGELAPGVPDKHSWELGRALAKRWQADVLLGMGAAVAGPDDRLHSYNSAVLIDRAGRLRGRYDKIHLVPFGEYVPVRDWLPWLSAFTPYPDGYSVQPGEQFTRFPLLARDGRRFTFGVVICYEDTVPEVARPYGGGGVAPVDFVLNISNDGWFDGTSEHEQHLAICRFRAVECRRSVARAVNMGISAVIDSNGRVVRVAPVPPPDGAPEGAVVWTDARERGRPIHLPVSEWAGFKKAAGVLIATVPIDSRSSFYARWGNWLPYSCWALILATLAVAFLRRRAAPAAGGA